MNTYTEEELLYIVETERGATQIKFTALALFLFTVGAISGFLVAYGIGNWGW